MCGNTLLAAEGIWLTGSTLRMEAGRRSWTGLLALAALFALVDGQIGLIGKEFSCMVRVR